MASELPLTEMVLAAGSLGAAAYGIVDGFKFSAKFASAGFNQIKMALGAPIYEALRYAYGSQFTNLMRAQYINGRSSGDLPRTLRQGVRLALNSENAEALAATIGHLDGKALKDAATAVETGANVSHQQRSLIARFEVAVDTRVDAALALAENKYKGVMQMRASGVSIVLAVIGSFAFNVQQNSDGLTHAFTFEDFVIALVVGIAAVPLAPIAKNVSTALQSVAKATKARA